VTSEGYENAASHTDLLLVYKYRSRVIIPDPTMFRAFRGNLLATGVERTVEQIEQIIDELVDTGGLTGPNALHELRLTHGDMVALWRSLKATGLWKSVSWRSAEVPRSSRKLPPNGGHPCRGKEPHK
jgi:hypothetical protein